MTKPANKNLEEARRRWGTARVLTGKPAPKSNPTPAAPAVAIRRAA